MPAPAIFIVSRTLNIRPQDGEMTEDPVSPELERCQREEKRLWKVCGLFLRLIKTHVKECEQFDDEVREALDEDQDYEEQFAKGEK